MMNDVIRGLIGNKHAVLYATNAEFKYVIDNLAATLPIWIAGLAEAATKAEKAKEYEVMLRETGNGR